MSAHPLSEGRVSLVGAGPGDPDLLTIRAMKAIQSADAILYDALIDLAILGLARPGTRLIDVGKRCGRHAMHQSAINASIVSLAREGAHVVRLKGGDPFVFGRGGEELTSLRAAGIPVTVIPGVTAACAAAASLQIPLTHRDIARSVHFVTGHGAYGTIPAHDWLALVRSGGTIAAYMAVRTLPAMAAALMAAGMAGATPAVAVENASRASERRLFGTIADLPAAVAAAAFDGPALMLIGAVVGLGQEIAIAELLGQRPVAPALFPPSWDADTPSMRSTLRPGLRTVADESIEIVTGRNAAAAGARTGRYASSRTAMSPAPR